jgi:hypothetical protein
MAGITIPNQSLSTTLTPTEFNQLLEALKDGTRDVTTAALAATGLSTLSGGVTLSNSNIAGIKNATFNSILTASETGTTKTIDWTTGNKQRLMARNNITLTFTAPPGAGRFDLRLLQDSVGSRTITWPSTVSWPSQTAPTLSTTAFRGDIITFDYDGTTYAAVASLAFTGI